MRLPIILALPLLASLLAGSEPVKLLNASYDVTREFYKDYNDLFARHWQATASQAVTIDQSHGGSSKQARAVIDGLEADVVTMNQALDIDQIAERGRQIPKDWAGRLPHNSAPTVSTILFLVRAGNPKGIKDWNDLTRPGVKVILPHPKTSGNGRYTYLAAWAYASRQNGNDPAKSEAFAKTLFANVPVFDTGGRGATITFSQRGIGDVLLTFESEVHLIRREATAEYEIVVPSLSILAENPVAVVEKIAAKHGTSAVARAYLEYLYTPEAQELAAKHYFRPRDAAVLARHAAVFPALTLVTVDEAVGGWGKALSEHFADGGIVDRTLAQ